MGRLDAPGTGPEQGFMRGWDCHFLSTSCLKIPIGISRLSGSSAHGRFDSDVDFTDSKLGAIFNATDPNLTAFKARRGKLIQYHGWSDPDISPLNSVNYYESVVKLIGGNSVHGMLRRRTFTGCSWCRECSIVAADREHPFSIWWNRWSNGSNTASAPDKIIASHATRRQS